MPEVIRSGAIVKKLKARKGRKPYLPEIVPYECSAWEMFTILSLYRKKACSIRKNFCDGRIILFKIIGDVFTDIDLAGA